MPDPQTAEVERAISVSTKEGSPVHQGRSGTPLDFFSGDNAYGSIAAATSYPDPQKSRSPVTPRGRKTAVHQTELESPYGDSLQFSEPYQHTQGYELSEDYDHEQEGDKNHTSQPESLEIIGQEQQYDDFDLSPDNHPRNPVPRPYPLGVHIHDEDLNLEDAERESRLGDTPSESEHDGHQQHTHPYDTFDSNDRPMSFPGNYIEPTNVAYRGEQRPQSTFLDLNPDAVYYPAPIPAQLRLPPLLSKKNQARGELPKKKARPQSMLKYHMPLASEWEPSPIDPDLSYDREEGNTTGATDIESMLVESEDEDSDRATILSDEDYQGLDDEEIEDMRYGNRPRSKKTLQKKKSGWFSGAFYTMVGKKGDPDERDPDVLEDPDDADRIDETADAFTRYDPELVHAEAQRFQVGGIYSGTIPRSGKPTSLIEELEIRKQGRILQKKGIIADANEAMREQTQANRLLHPLDQEHQPTMMELKHLADIDYKTRVQWHQEATTKKAQQEGEESLAQRKARRRAEKAKASGTTEIAPVNETLAQRRQRLKREKLRRQDMILRADTDSDVGSAMTGSVAEHPSGHRNSTPGPSSDAEKQLLTGNSGSISPELGAYSDRATDLHASPGRGMGSFNPTQENPYELKHVS